MIAIDYLSYLVNTSPFGIPAIRDNTEAFLQGALNHDALTLVEQGAANGTGLAHFFYYPTQFVDITSRVCYLFESYILGIVPSAFASIWNSPSFQYPCASIGIAINTLIFIKSMTSWIKSVRLNSTLESFECGKKDLKGAIQKLNQSSLITLKDVLPEWTCREIFLRGGNDYLTDLSNRVSKNDKMSCREASELLSKIKTYMGRKRVEIALEAAGAVVGILACIAFMLNAPLALILALTALGTLLIVATFIIRRGWVENQEEKFSFLPCFPQFIQSWIKKTPENLEDELVMDSPYKSLS